MSCETEYKDIDMHEISEQLKSTRKALVDRVYVDYESTQLFKYNIDFNQFLDDINYIIESIKTDG